MKKLITITVFVIAIGFTKSSFAQITDMWSLQQFMLTIGENSKYSLQLGNMSAIIAEIHSSSMSSVDQFKTCSKSVNIRTITEVDCRYLMVTGVLTLFFVLIFTTVIIILAYILARNSR